MSRYSPKVQIKTIPNDINNSIRATMYKKRTVHSKLIRTRLKVLSEGSNFENVFFLFSLVTEESKKH